MSICVHWAFAFIPVLLLALVLYIAKLPLKVDEKIEKKFVGGKFNNAKTKK